MRNPVELAASAETSVTARMPCEREVGTTADLVRRCGEEAAGAAARAGEEDGRGDFGDHVARFVPLRSDTLSPRGGEAHGPDRFSPTETPPTAVTNGEDAGKSTAGVPSSSLSSP